VTPSFLPIVLKAVITAREEIVAWNYVDGVVPKQLRMSVSGDG